MYFDTRRPIRETKIGPIRKICCSANNLKETAKSVKIRKKKYKIKEDCLQSSIFPWFAWTAAILVCNSECNVGRAPKLLRSPLQTKMHGFSSIEAHDLDNHTGRWGTINSLGIQWTVHASECAQLLLIIIILSHIKPRKECLTDQWAFSQQNSRFWFYTGLSTIFHVTLILVIEIRRPSIVELTAKKAGKIQSIGCCLHLCK